MYEIYNCIFAFCFVIMGLFFWIFSYRNRHEKLNQIFPIIKKYRTNQLHLLFKNREDVVWFAFWPFLIGLMFFILTIIIIYK